MGSLTVSDFRTRLYIAGGPGGSSIAPSVHEFIAKTMGKSWTMEFLQLETAVQVMEVYRRPDFRGGVVTMPHKRTVIPLIDRVDEYVDALSACNLIYPSAEGQLCGTNTDWVGIRDAILLNEERHVSGRVAMVYGAGGAARAATYALLQVLNCSQLYVINRDKTEVEELIEDVSKYYSTARSDIIHIESVDHASTLSSPRYIVSTVPDGAAVAQPEIEARKTLAEFISRESKGLLVDMCYHPLITTNLELAQRNGWKTVNGVAVVGYQLSTQWSFFASGDIPKEAPAMLHALSEEEASRSQRKAGNHEGMQSA